MNNIQNHPLYSVGSMETRRCNNGWEYCNGKCDTCYMNKIYEQELSKDYEFPYITDTNVTQGFPKYLFRRIL